MVEKVGKADGGMPLAQNLLSLQAVDILKQFIISSLELKLYYGFSSADLIQIADLILYAQDF